MSTEREAGYDNPWIASERLFERSIRRVNSQGLLIIGSVGRAVVFNEFAGDPLLEIRARGESPIEAYYSPGRNRPRDIDVIGGKPEGERRSYWPHTAGNDAFEGLVRDGGGGWSFVRWYRGDKLKYPLDPIIFEPFKGRTIKGIECVTVRPATHVALLIPRLGGHRRENDELANDLLMKVVPPEEKELLRSEGYQEFIGYLRW